MYREADYKSEDKSLAFNWGKVNMEKDRK